MTLSTDVTRRALHLGGRDSVSGWCEKKYVAETIEMIIVNRAAAQIATLVGRHVRLDALGICIDHVEIGDEVKTSNNVYYEVETVQEHWLADSFLYRTCDLTLLPLHED